MPEIHLQTYSQKVSVSALHYNVDTETVEMRRELQVLSFHRTAFNGKKWSEWEALIRGWRLNLPPGTKPPLSQEQIDVLAQQVNALNERAAAMDNEPWLL